MKRTGWKVGVISFCAVYLAVHLTAAVTAGEHPGQAAEHPGTSTHKEHPGTTHEQEHPGTSKEHPGQAQTVSAAAIISAIDHYIKTDQGLKGGYFLVYDEKDNRVRQLKLDKIHKERVSVIKKTNEYFACVDFNSVGTKDSVDIDFWMKRDSNGNLDVTNVKIHKLNGKPRFTYKDDDIVEVK